MIGSRSRNMAAVLALSAMAGVASGGVGIPVGDAPPSPFPRRARRRVPKAEPTAHDLERIARAEAKRARKAALRRSIP